MKFVLASTALILLFSSVPLFADAQKGWETHTVEGLYSFKHPSNWKLEDRENRFTSIDAKLVYGNNDVQMVFESGESLTYGSQSDDLLLGALKSVAEGKNNGEVFESGSDKYTVNNRTAPYVLGTYSVDTLFGSSLEMVQLSVLVHLDDDQLVLIRYLAEENDFDRHLPKAEQVIKSFSPVGAAA